MTMLYRYLIVLLLAGSAVQSSAEEANDPDANTGTESTPATTAKSPGQRADAGKSPPAGQPTTDVFIPTEEISEDFAVSFPVDI